MPGIRHALFIAPVTHRKKPLFTGTGNIPWGRKTGGWKEGVTPIKENRFIRMDEAVFVHGHTQSFYMERLVERAAELMSLPTASTSLPTPPIVWQETHPRSGDTQNNQFAFHRFIGRVPSGQTPFLRTPFKEPFMMPHRRSCHSPFLPCAPATLKKHASTGENIRRTFRPRSRNHYYLLPR